MRELAPVLGRRLCGIVWVVVGAGCSSGEAVPADAGLDRREGSLDGPSRDVSSDAREAGGGSALENALASKGFIVQKGAFAFDTNLAASCCAAPTCFGNNPNSPYATFNLPPAPGEADAGTALAPFWRLRQDEAVLLVTRTPPTAKYFGFTSYLFGRAKGTSRELLFADLGDTVNNLAIAAAPEDGGSGGPFDARALILLTGNQSVAKEVESAVASAGYPTRIVNSLPLPASLVQLGLDSSASTLGVVHRFAVPADADAGLAYVNNPGGTLYRLTPRSEIPATPYGVPPLRSDTPGVSEAPLQASVTSLAAAIAAANAGATSTTLSVAIRPPTQDNQYGTYCIQHGVDCGGDNRDATYPITSAFLLGAQEYVIVYGVNHEATGKASYSSFALYEVAKALGVAGVVSPQFVGSARAFLPSDPNVDKLYAWKIARSCGSDPYCTVVPTTCPGVPLTGLAVIAFRAYLDPKTKTRPNPSDLVIDGAIHFSP
jgi:hypothetical protein